MKMTRKCMSAALVLGLTLFPAIVKASPDAIYINGNVITVDESFSLHTSFAIEGEKFTAVGGPEIQLLADEETKIIDLHGMTVIPGLIDNHNHFIRGAQHWTTTLRLDGVNTRADALHRLKEHAANLSEDEWFLVLGGWHEDQFTDDPTGFTREELDEIAGSRPAFLQAQYSHAFVNTSFLELIGAKVEVDPSSIVQPNLTSELNKTFGPPLSQLIERDEKGRATSRLKGGMGMVIQTATIMPDMALERISLGVRSAQAHYNSLGLTTVYDPGGALPSRDSYKAIEDLHASSELTLRIFRTAIEYSTDKQAVSRVLRLFRPMPDWFSDIALGLVRDPESTAGTIEFVKNLPRLSDGDDFYDTLAIGEVFYLPMHDSKRDFREGRKLSDRSMSELKTLMTEVIARKVPAQIHAVDARTIEIYLLLIEELTEGHPLRPNQITITHGEGVTKGQLRRMRDLNISLQIRSMSVVRSRDGLIADFTNRAIETPPLRDINESGVRWGLGTDGTKAAQINPLRTLHWAITGRAINGDQILDSDQLLSRQEALIAHTRANAYLVGKDSLLGQIQPGFLADFVVLDEDYLTVDSNEILEINVLKTVVGGETVYQRGN